VIGGLRLGVIIPAYNEAERLKRLLPAIPMDLVDQVVLVDDASTDATSEVGRACGACVITHMSRTGPGPAIRDALDLLRSQDFAAVAVMAANGKHDPAQIADLVRPLVDEELDLVRGSRFLAGGAQVNMPWHRLAFIQLFTWLTWLAVGQRVTDATGGFQAYRLRILDDPEIDLHQPWLDQRYQVETYLFVKTLLRGYRWKEVAVHITYPQRGRYTRARMVVDWWSYFSPVVLLRFGLRH
jgi:glycosyltransferase involved in cell wall biosynthesis